MRARKHVYNDNWEDSRQAPNFTSYTAITEGTMDDDNEDEDDGLEELDFYAWPEAALEDWESDDDDDWDEEEDEDEEEYEDEDE